MGAFLPRWIYVQHVFFLILLVGGYFVLQNKITVGELVVFNGLAQRFTMPMRMIGWLTSDLQRFNASSSKIRELLAVEPSIKNTGIRLDDLDIKGKIEFKDVTFRYQTAPVLYAINLRFAGADGDFWRQDREEYCP